MSSSSSTFIKHDPSCACPQCDTPDGLLIGNVPPSRTLQLLRAKAGGAFSGLKPIKTRLYSTFFSTASAAGGTIGAQNNITLTAGNFSELSSYMVLYDEIRILSVTAQCFAMPLVAGTDAAFVVFGLHFDPTAGVPAAPMKVQEESHHTGPKMIGPSMITTHHEPMKIHARLPRLTTTVGNQCVGSNWQTLDSTSANTVAVIAQYVSSLGGAGVSRTQVQLILDCEFRMRT